MPEQVRWSLPLRTFIANGCRAPADSRQGATGRAVTQTTAPKSQAGRLGMAPAHQSGWELALDLGMTDPGDQARTAWDSH